jgi:hypothetical protein
MAVSFKACHFLKIASQSWDLIGMYTLVDMKRQGWEHFSLFGCAGERKYTSPLKAGVSVRWRVIGSRAVTLEVPCMLPATLIPDCSEIV